MSENNMPDMQEILQQAQAMQSSIQAAQDEVAASVVTGQAGGGLVEIDLRGSGLVMDLRIDPKVVDPEDVDNLQDLIIGAFADAQKQMQELMNSKFGHLNQALNGGDLGALFS